ncbi:hypothetical protein JW992_16415 [candidate division KSB1 bacterium]|nr:hypothetical protein [candidate division KSB1 bacterium]
MAINRSDSIWILFVLLIAVMSINAADYRGQITTTLGISHSGKSHMTADLRAVSEAAFGPISFKNANVDLVCSVDLGLQNSDPITDWECVLLRLNGKYVWDCNKSILDPPFFCALCDGLTGCLRKTIGFVCTCTCLAVQYREQPVDESELYRVRTKKRSTLFSLFAPAGLTRRMNGLHLIRRLFSDLHVRQLDIGQRNRLMPAATRRFDSMRWGKRYV